MTKRFYRGNLPHYDPKDAPYFITYRLEGSIPISEVNRLRQLYQDSKSAASQQKFFLSYDEVLDRNGPYHLKEPRILKVVTESLDFLSKDTLYIWAYTVMPNHVHLVANITDKEQPLFRILQSHKRHTARESNKILQQTGQKFWKRENHDHVIREGRLGNAIWYVLLNPVKAGFVKHWRDWPGTYLSPGCYGFD